MEKVEVIAIAHARDEAVEISVPEEARFEVVDGGDAAEVRFVQPDECESGGAGDQRDCYCLRCSVVGPVCAVQVLVPWGGCRCGEDRLLGGCSQGWYDGAGLWY